LPCLQDPYSATVTVSADARAAEVAEANQKGGCYDPSCDSSSLSDSSSSPSISLFCAFTTNDLFYSLCQTTTTIIHKRALQLPKSHIYTVW